MPRALRSYDAHSVLHVVNRGNDRRQLFADDRDYASFIGLMAWAQSRARLRLVAYALMPNHWHLVVWPRDPVELSRFMRDVTGAHAAILRTESGTRGSGHIYQDRYHAFVVDSDARYYRTLRYVEANPVRAGLVDGAHRWPWSSLRERLSERRLIGDGPLPLPPMRQWLEHVNAALTAEDLASIRPKRARHGIGRLWTRT